MTLTPSDLRLAGVSRNDFVQPRNQVYVVRSNNPWNVPARKKLVAEIEHQEDGNANTSSPEVGGIPMTTDEVGEAADE